MTELIELNNPKPQWNEYNSRYMFISECEIELKAFITFYMLVLWPDEIRCKLNKTFKNPDDPNYNMDKTYYTWNQDCYGVEEELKKWFPFSIFPNGPHFDEETELLSLKYRAALDLLIEDFFKVKKMILIKTHEMGLSWYADESCTVEEPLVMTSVINRVKSIIFNIYLINF